MSENLNVDKDYKLTVGIAEQDKHGHFKMDKKRGLVFKTHDFVGKLVYKSDFFSIFTGVKPNKKTIVEDEFMEIIEGDLWNIQYDEDALERVKKILKENAIPYEDIFKQNEYGRVVVSYTIEHFNKIGMLVLANDFMQKVIYTETDRNGNRKEIPGAEYTPAPGLIIKITEFDRKAFKATKLALKRLSLSRRIPRELMEDISVMSGIEKKSDSKKSDSKKSDSKKSDSKKNDSKKGGRRKRANNKTRKNKV